MKPSPEQVSDSTQVGRVSRARPPLLDEPLDVILRDGGTLRLRSPSAKDEGAVLAFLSSLSEDSFYRRFHGTPSIRPALVDPFLDPDWWDHGDLIGTRADETGAEQVVALASYVRLRDPTAAEVAFGRGRCTPGAGDRHPPLGEARGARGERRHRALRGRGHSGEPTQCCACSKRLASRSATPSRAARWRSRFRSRRREEYMSHVDERDHLAVVASLRPFFAPTSLVVIGASPDAGRSEVASSATSSPPSTQAPPTRSTEAANRLPGFVRTPRSTSCRPTRPCGRLCPRRPRPRLGQAALRQASLRSASSPPVSPRPGPRGLNARSGSCARPGPRRTPDRPELPRDRGLERHSRRHLRPTGSSSGTIGFSSQSGALGLALLEKAAERDLGLSAFVSIGNKADVSSNDLLEYWEQDSQTNLVLLYLESFGNPRRFGRIARRVTRRKPILAMKSGTTAAGARAASSHTAALAGSEAAVEALFHRQACWAETLESLIDAAALLSTQPLPRGRRVAILTNAGGLGILAADTVQDAEGLELPDAPARDHRQGPLEGPSRRSQRRQSGGHAGLGYRRDVWVGPASLARGLIRGQRDRPLRATVIARADEVATAVISAARSGRPGRSRCSRRSSAKADCRLPCTERAPIAVFPYPSRRHRPWARRAAPAEWLQSPAGGVPRVDGVHGQAGRAVVEAALRGGRGAVA